jgi:hypothetical protein
VSHVVCCSCCCTCDCCSSCRCSCCLRGLRLQPTLPPLLYKLLLTMTHDHRTSQESLAVQASRATGALAGQRPAPGPCGPVARLPRQFVVIDGVRLSVTDPCFGSSSAPACPDPNTHVWLQGAWRKVLTETYAATAGSRTGTPLTANRTTRVAALSTNPANPAAAAAPACRCSCCYSYNTRCPGSK